MCVVIQTPDLQDIKSNNKKLKYIENLKNLLVDKPAVYQTMTELSKNQGHSNVANRHYKCPFTVNYESQQVIFSFKLQKKSLIQYCVLMDYSFELKKSVKTINLL